MRFLRLALTLAALGSSRCVLSAPPDVAARSVCPRSAVPAAKSLCEQFLGVGNNESRTCERAVEELAAALSCPGRCPADMVLFTAESGAHVYCAADKVPCYR